MTTGLVVRPSRVGKIRCTIGAVQDVMGESGDVLLGDTPSGEQATLSDSLTKMEWLAS